MARTAAHTETKISTTKKYLVEVGAILKSEEDAENEAFEKKWNNPTNLTLDESKQSTLKYVRELWANK